MLRIPKILDKISVGIAGKLQVRFQAKQTIGVSIRPQNAAALDHAFIGGVGNLKVVANRALESTLLHIDHVRNVEGQNIFK